MPAVHIMIKQQEFVIVREAGLRTGPIFNRVRVAETFANTSSKIFIFRVRVRQKRSSSASLSSLPCSKYPLKKHIQKIWVGGMQV